MKRLTALRLLLLLLIPLSVTGVLATWRYAVDPAKAVSLEFTPSIREFYYTPEEILPGEEQTEINENHLLMIQQILNHGSGLNAGPGSLIHSNLDEIGDTVSSNDNSISGGNFKKMLLAGTQGADKIDFVIEMVAEDTYYAYTVRTGDLVRNNDRQFVEVYLTIMQRDSMGVWSAHHSHYGKAQVYNLKNKIYSISPTTWYETDRPEAT